MKFTGNSRGVRIGIVILLALFGAGALGYCSRADAAEGLSIGFGVAMAGSERCFESMLLAQEFGERRWLGFLNTHGPSSGCRDGEAIDPNIAAGVVRTTSVGYWRIGFGAALRQHGDVVVGGADLVDVPAPRRDDSPQLVAAIFVRRELGKRLAIDLLHFSTGGSTHFNRGLNAATVSYRF